jgi:hypothetical protein
MLHVLLALLRPVFASPEAEATVRQPKGGAGRRDTTDALGQRQLAEVDWWGTDNRADNLQLPTTVVP